MDRNLKVNKAKPREDRAVAPETAVVVMEDSPAAVATKRLTRKGVGSGVIGFV